MILAGGQGTRFGTYKPVFQVCGRTLFEHLQRRIRNLYETILVVVSSESQARQLRKCPGKFTILTDRITGIGPLGGILTGTLSAQTEYCHVLAVDSPVPNAKVLKYLDFQAHGADAAIPIWPDGQIEPLHGVYRNKITCREADRLIRQGERSVISLVRALPNIRRVNIEELRQMDPNLDTFANINTQNDLQAITETLRNEV